MDQAELEKTLNTSIEEQAFSGVISIRQKDHVLYARAADYADRSNKIENSLETRFGINLGTKFFTALAIGKLIEAQKLSFSTQSDHRSCSVADKQTHHSVGRSYPAS